MDIKKGWICPRCEKINSPYIDSCNCNQNKIEELKHQIDCANEYHEWVFTGKTTTHINYRCKYCNKTVAEWCEPGPDKTIQKAKKRN